MSNIKTATLTFRIMPQFKEALRRAADREHRSIANMVEALIRDYCIKNKIVIGNKADSMIKTTGESKGLKNDKERQNHSKYICCFHDVAAKTIFENPAQVVTLFQLRNTILPKLFSGQLSIKDTEKFIGNIL